MAIKKLTYAAVIVIAIAAMVLISMAVIDGVSDTLRDSTTTTRNITLDNGTAVSLINTWVTNIASVTNASNTSQAVVGYTAATSVKGVAGTVTLTNNSWDGLNATVTYTYNAATTSSNNADLFRAGLGVFATFMAIIVLALVGKAIIGYFKGRR